MAAMVKRFFIAAVSVANAVLVKIKPVRNTNFVIMMKPLVNLPFQSQKMTSK